jgi:sulfur relay (sulfurtransferase) DsrC/TusE family protein
VTEVRFFKGREMPLSVPELNDLLTPLLCRFIPPLKFDINVIGSRTDLVLRVNIYTEKKVREMMMWTRDFYFDFGTSPNPQRIVNDFLAFYMELKTTPIRESLSDQPARRLADIVELFGVVPSQEEGRTRKIEIESTQED